MQKSKLRLVAWLFSHEVHSMIRLWKSSMLEHWKTLQEGWVNGLDTLYELFLILDDLLCKSESLNKYNTFSQLRKKRIYQMVQIKRVSLTEKFMTPQSWNLFPGCLLHIWMLLFRIFTRLLPLGEWLLTIKNARKCALAFRSIARFPQPLSLVVSSLIEKVSCYKLLGVHLSDNLTWNEHVTHIVKKGSKRLYAIRSAD